MLAEKVHSAITQYALIQSGDRVLVGVSGGADSVALLHVLLALRDTLNFSVYAAHFNHGIRGTEADEDQAFVQNLCVELGVSCLVRKTDIPAIAKERGHSLEQAARDCRYAFLREAATQYGANCIAVAHHMDDQAETLLLHLARGSGLTGLAGMRPKNGDIIRPLLYTRRAQIEEYLRENGVCFRTDSTNLSPEHARNRLRLDVIPYFERNVNPAFVASLCSTAELLREDEAYLAGLAKEALASAQTQLGYDRQKLSALPMPILSRAIRMALAYAGAMQDIERQHVHRIIALLDAPTGTRLHVPRADVWLDYESVCFGVYPEPSPTDVCVGFVAEGTYTLPDGIFTCTRCNTPPEGYKVDRTTAYLDAAKLMALQEQGAALCFRSRRPGDRFSPIGAPGSKKLKDFFIDKKVSRSAREGSMLCAGGEVLFLPGHGVSTLVRLDTNTKEIICIKFRDAKSHQ